MFRRFAFLLLPRWLLLYALVIVSTITMVLLGRWQLHRAHQRHGDLQNYSYVLQWWAFSVFVVFMLVRVMRDAIQAKRDAALAAAGEPVPDRSANSTLATAEPQMTPAYRRYVPPTAQSDLDSTQLAYNDYLASLSEPDASKDRS